MADKEQAEAARRMAPKRCRPPKGKLKLIIAVVGVLAILGGGAATWFLFFRAAMASEAKHAEARAGESRRPSWMCRTCWSTWSARPASACNISR